MEVKNLLASFIEHNNKGGAYVIHLNSGNLDETKSHKNNDVEFSDMYFTDCRALANGSIISFGNSKRKPLDYKEDGTPLYPVETGNGMFLNLDKIEAVEEIRDPDDWFEMPCHKVVNVYMFPDNKAYDGHRNVLSIGYVG